MVLLTVFTWLNLIETVFPYFSTAAMTVYGISHALLHDRLLLQCGLQFVFCSTGALIFTPSSTL